MGIVTQLTASHQFAAGLTTGAIAVGAVLLLGASGVLGRRSAIAGLAFGVAGIAALDGWGPLDAALPLSTSAHVGLVLLALGGLALQLAESIDLTWRALATAPGAAVLAADLRHVEPRWIAPATGIAIIVGTALAGDFDHTQRRRALGPLLLIGTVGGVYATVPDTEGLRALVGAALVLVILVVPRAVASLGAGGTALAVGLVLHTAAREGAARSGAVVGAIGCLGLLVLEPIGRRVFAHQRIRGVHGVGGPYPAIAIGTVLHGATVLWAARVAGLRSNAAEAVLLLIPAVLLGIFTWNVLPRPPRGGAT